MQNARPIYGPHTTTHILFKFKHHTKIQLNYQKIKEAITKRLGLTNIYMYNKLVRNSGNDNILEYLNKYV